MMLKISRRIQNFLQLLTLDGPFREGVLQVTEPAYIQKIGHLLEEI